VGHSMRVPLLPESAVMCWPQTGHANLKSLMSGARVLLAAPQHGSFVRHSQC
jgi:hypothetical protein